MIMVEHDFALASLTLECEEARAFGKRQAS